ncbi:MurR/RpiR family transcriptional regulator [Lacticaseibacillus saniviri]
MPILKKMTENRSRLSSAEAKVADYITKAPERVLKMTVQELATAATASPAAVIRLGKRIGVQGFTQLKIELAADLTQQQLAMNPPGDVVKNEKVSSIKDKLRYNAQTSLNETVDQLDNQLLHQSTQLIATAKRMFAFGTGASYLTAENIAQKWGRLGYVVVAFKDLNELLPLLANAQSADLLWVISNTGESPEAVLAAQAAADAGVQVLSLTQSGTNTVSQLSTVALHTSRPLEYPNRIAATNSLMIQFMVIDIVFYDLVSQHYETSAAKLVSSSQRVKTYKDAFNRHN